MAKQTNELRFEDGKYTGKVSVEGMSVKGGDLPNGFQVHLDVEFDFTGVSPIDVAEAACGGQSLRVVLQGDLRKESTSTLNKYAEEGYLCKVSELVNRERASRDPKVVIKSAFSKMTREQKVESVMDLMKVTKEQAEQMVPAE
jgi:hypothetical protein